MANQATQTYIETQLLIAQFALTVATTPEQLEVAKDRIAGLELYEQYYNNPNFKKALEDHVYELTQERTYRIPEPTASDLTEEEWATREANLVKGRTVVDFDDLEN